MDIKKIIRLVTETKELVKNREMAAHVKEKGVADYVTQDVYKRQRLCRFECKMIFL